MDLSFSGLASGFDWKTFVNNIIATESAPITSIKAEQQTNSAKSSALVNLQSLITTLQGASTALAAPTLFAGRQVTSTTANSTWSPLADTGTVNGSYQIAVSQLASAARIQGTSNLGSTLSATNDVSALTIATLPTATAVTAGFFTVNGHQVNVAQTDSLDQVFAAIATATGNTVTAAYDHTTDKITLTSTGPEIVLGAANDTSNFLSALKLGNNAGTSVTSAGTLGVFSSTATIANARLKAPITAVDATGNGSFTVNGVTINYNVNTDTIGSVLTQINQSGAGVTAAYDATNDRIALTNSSTGDIGVSVNETAGGLLGALGLTTGATFVHGTNAQFSVNGGQVRSATSNSLSALDLGVPGLSVTVNSKDTQTLVVSGNNSSMTTAISNFITAYNDVQSYLDTSSAITNNNGVVTAGILASNRDVQEWGSSMRSKVFSAVPGLTGTIQRLSDLGIDFTPGTGQLAIIDNTKLTTALDAHPADVTAFFQTAATGLAFQFSSYTATLLTNDTQQQNTLTQNNKDLDTQIATIQRRLDQQKSLLTASFVAMEAAQSQMQSQLAALNSAFGTTTSSSSNTSVSTPKG
jgi:flagellar hook-associated protein 2